MLNYSKKILLKVLLAIGIIATVISASIADRFESGDGTESDPYIIKTVAQFSDFAALVNNSSETFEGKFIKLNNNIVLNDTSDWKTWSETTKPLNTYHPIGEFLGYTIFEGTFDGNGFVIEGAYIEPGSFNDYVGIFGVVGNGGKIINLGIVASFVKGNNLVGGLVGCIMENATIENSYFIGKVVGGEKVGGLVGMGHMDGSNNIIGSYAIGNVKGSRDDVGGLVGSFGGTGGIYSSYSMENAEGRNNVGGLVGDLRSGNQGIRNSYAMGVVTADNDNAGGLVGLLEYSGNPSPIINCYSAGKALANSAGFGGLIGATTLPISQIDSDLFINSFYDNQYHNVPDVRGQPKTTAEMQSINTYTDWSFGTIWGINSAFNDGYPFLLKYGEDKTIDVIWENQDVFVYNGMPQAPAVRGILPNGTSFNLVADIYRKISGFPPLDEGAIDVGKYYSHIAIWQLPLGYKLKSDEVSKDFEIIKAPISPILKIENTTVENVNDLVYEIIDTRTGNVFTLISSIRYFDSDTSTNSIYPPTAPGIYFIAATIADTRNNYISTETPRVQFSIFDSNAESVKVDWGTTLSFAYDGTMKAPTATVTSSENGRVIPLIVTGRIDAGINWTATARLAEPDEDFYLKETKIKFTITPKTLTKEMVMPLGTYLSNLGIVKPAIQVTDGGKRLFESRDFLISYENDNTVKITGTGNYTGEISVNIPRTDHSELALSMPATVEWGNLSLVYNGTAQAPAATIAVDVFGKTYPVNIVGAQTNAGEYLALATVSAQNVNLTNALASFTIRPAELQVEWLGGTDLTFNKMRQSPMPKEIEGIQWSVTGAQRRIGNGYTAVAQIVSANAGNYILSNNEIAYKITRRDLEVRLDATKEEKTLDVNKDNINETDIPDILKGLVRYNFAIDTSGIKDKADGISSGEPKIAITLLADKTVAFEEPDYSLRSIRTLTEDGDLKSISISTILEKFLTKVDFRDVSLTDEDSYKLPDERMVEDTMTVRSLILKGIAGVNNNAPKVGDFITADIPPVIAEKAGELRYSWYADDELLPDVSIASYLVKYADIGKEIRFEVKADDASGMSVSAAIAKVIEGTTSILGNIKSDGRWGIRFAETIVSDKAEISVKAPEELTGIKIVIYDMTGNAVKTLAFSNVVFATNERSGKISWDLRNNAGRLVANGTYLVISEATTNSGKRYHYSAKLGVKR